MKCPEITTARLKFIKLKDSHFEDLYSLVSNVRVQQYFPSTLTRDETRTFYSKILKRYRDDGFCFLAVTRKDDNAFLGICGLLKQKISNRQEIEIGYRLQDKYWGNGFATESVKAFIQYAKKKKLTQSLIILSVPENLPSIKVARRCGFTFEEEVLFQGLPHHLYRLKL